MKVCKKKEKKVKNKININSTVDRQGLQPRNELFNFNGANQKEKKINDQRKKSDKMVANCFNVEMWVCDEMSNVNHFIFFFFVKFS